MNLTEKIGQTAMVASAVPRLGMARCVAALWRAWADLVVCLWHVVTSEWLDVCVCVWT
jgi:hypothetical protein